MENANNRMFNFQINISTLVLIAIIVIGGKIGYNMYMEKEKDLRIAKQNQSALTDSVRVTKNKLDDAVYAKEVFVAETNKELKALSEDLGQTMKEYSGKIHELTILTAEIKNDVEDLADTGDISETPEGNQSYDWVLNKKYDQYNSRLLKGTNVFRYDKETNSFTTLPTKITHDEIKFKLVQGLRTTDDGKIEIFASSTYPGFNASSFESAIIDPKKHPALKEFTREKKWNIGLYGGYGVTTNLSTGIVMAGPQIGFGASYRLW